MNESKDYGWNRIQARYLLHRIYSMLHFMLKKQQQFKRICVIVTKYLITLES